MTTTPLDEALEARTTEIGMTWAELARRTDMSVSHLSAIRSGIRNPSRIARRKLEDAVGWAHGSIASIEDGQPPVPVDDADLDDLLDQVYAQSRRTGQAPEDIIAAMNEALRNNSTT